MFKIKKAPKEIGIFGNRAIRRNPNTKKNSKKKGKSLMETLKETTDPKTRKPQFVPPPISPEDAAYVKAQLQSGIGRTLLQTLEPISRRDLHPNNLNISYDPKVNAIDIHVVFVDTNTPLWSNLQRVMWQNRMTWRFDGTGPQLMLILRWFLPYEFPKLVAVDPGEEEIPTAEEEVGQTKQSTIEPPEGTGPKEAMQPQAVSE